MNKYSYKAVLALIGIMMCPILSLAQNDDWIIDDDWIDQSDINTFNSEVKKRYDNYRDSINVTFARALAGEGKINFTEAEADTVVALA